MHQAIEIIEGIDAGGGRGFFMQRAPPGDVVLPVGTLLLEEKPLLLAEDYFSLEAAVLALATDSELPLSQSGVLTAGVLAADGEADVLRSVLLTMYAGTGLQDATLQHCARGLLAHNMHSADEAPWQGRLPSKSGPLGLWPTASLINHSFAKANVTRSFEAVTRTVSYRVIRELHPGDELLDNYINPRFTYAERAKDLLSVHGIREELDEFDAPKELLSEAHSATAQACSMIACGEGEKAFFQLMPLWERLAKRSSNVEFCVQADPALSQFFESFADAALAADLRETAMVHGLECAFHLLCGREPYSYHSAILAFQLASLAESLVQDEAALWSVDGDEAEAAIRAGLSPEDIAAKAAKALGDVQTRAAKWQHVSHEHWRIVFGDGKMPLM